MNFGIFCIGLALIVCASPANSTAMAKETTRGNGCVCDAVMKPLFWKVFLPAYLRCGGDIVCLLRNIEWLKGNDIDASSVAKTFKKGNESWFASTTLLNDITACSDTFAAASTNDTKEKCVQFLKCVQDGLNPHLCDGCVDKYWDMYLRIKNTPFQDVVDEMAKEDP